MRKKQLNLKKLLIKKSVVSNLNEVTGGADGSSVIIRCDYTQKPSCNGHCVTQVGQTCIQNGVCLTTANTYFSCNAGTGCPTGPVNCTPATAGNCTIGSGG